MPADWPFSDPENVAVFTLKRIVRGESPIVRVTHDEDDGGWQFLDGGEVAVEEASVVSLRQITRIDPSILELADLPLGWVAERAGPGEPWQRAPAVQKRTGRGSSSRTSRRSAGRHHDPRGRRRAVLRLQHRTLPVLRPPGDHRLRPRPGPDAPDDQPDRRGGPAGSSVRRRRVRLGHPRRLRRAVPHVAHRHYPEHFGYARWFYKGDDFPALQCLWPDKQGRFPSDADYSEPLRARQCLLVS